MFLPSSRLLYRLRILVVHCLIRVPSARRTLHEHIFTAPDWWLTATNMGPRIAISDKGHRAENVRNWPLMTIINSSNDTISISSTQSSSIDDIDVPLFHNAGARMACT